MSTGAPTPLRPAPRLSASVRWGVLLWAILGIACAVNYWWTSETTARTAARSDDLSRSVEELRRTIEDGPKTLKTEVTQIQNSAHVLQQKLETVEDVLGQYRGQFQTLQHRSSAAESQQAVERAHVIELATQVKMARAQLEKLQTLGAAWQAREATWRTGDAGRRLAASPAHLELVESLLREERPSAEQSETWSRQLAVLAPLVEAAAENSGLVITADHGRALTDLGQAVAAALAKCEQQERLVEACLRETAGQPAQGPTLESVLNERRQQAERMQEERLRAAQQAARDEADRQEVERMAQVERELGDERLKARETARRQDAERARARDQEEEERKAEEARLVQAANRARNLGLKAEADRAVEALRVAQLAREFDRVAAEAKTLLKAFITPGFRHRVDGTKGPIALSFIKSQGALDPTQNGLEQLLRLASYNNDRELGGLPHFVTGALTVGQEARRKPVERAQELLNKYGEVLVQRGLLDP